VQLAWNEVKSLESLGARHRTKGYRLDKVDLQEMIGHALKELEELDETVIAGSPDIKELADIFGCLIHFAVRNGWMDRDADSACSA